MSALLDELEEYLAIRRALGSKLRDTEHELRKFVTFMDEQDESSITTAVAFRWASRSKEASKAHQAALLSKVRLFARYIHAKNPQHEVPPPGLLPHRVRRAVPYLYTEDEIMSLLDAARRLPSERGLRGHTYETLLGLLAVAGLRISEVVSLDSEDIDLEAGTLTIRSTKFGKTRLVPVHRTTREVLETYAGLRDRLTPCRTSKAFFVSEQGVRLVINTVEQAFVRLSRQIGLRGPADRTGPRLHDMRHRFAVETLLNWYRQDLDAGRHLPELATYLGHVHVADTYWYLQAVPELLALAAERSERRSGGAE